jgi:tellurite resistance protein TerC
MGTWTLWIAFNLGVGLLLLLDLGLFHRRAHAIALREAAMESIVWVALSVGFGSWIFFSHGRGPGLEFLTGYVIEKSLSVDNVFVFLLIFQYFHVDPRYQHRLLFWGVLGALVLRGAMIGLGAILIQRFDWILYLFGAFLLYGGFKLFRADRSVHPEKNTILNWAKRILPLSPAGDGQKLFVREAGRWLATPLFLVVIVLETTDLILAVDSIPAVFGVTRDPFIVYSSNVCAILGLRAIYFLLAGIMPFFQYLDEGLAVVLMFIGAKMLAEPWVHISTGLSLSIVGAVITIAVIVSIVTAKPQVDRSERMQEPVPRDFVSPSLSSKNIQNLFNEEPGRRTQAAHSLFVDGIGRIASWLERLCKDEEFQGLIVHDRIEPPYGDGAPLPRLTVGVAVLPATFAKIRAANGSPALSIAPSDQDVIEFELEFEGDFVRTPRLDILTTKAPDSNGAIARFLQKFGERIQQLEIDVSDVDRVTEILRTRFKIEPIYPATRPGANGTRVNFFLVSTSNDKKVLVELVEQPKTIPE